MLRPSEARMIREMVNYTPDVTWRDGDWEPSPEECRRMAEAVLDFWYSPRAVTTAVDPETGEPIEGMTVLILQTPIHQALCSSVPPAYAGPIEGEATS